MQLMTESSSAKTDKASQYIEARDVKRIFTRFNISLSTLSNSLHELLATSPINAIHLLKTQKGGLEEFAKNVQITRQLIADLFLSLDVDPEQLEVPNKKYTSRSIQSKVMLSKLQSGMTGCRNSIQFLLEKNKPLLKKEIQSVQYRSTLGELQKVYELLTVFESDDRKTIEAFLREFQSNNDSSGRPLDGWRVKKPTSPHSHPTPSLNKEGEALKSKPPLAPTSPDRPISDFRKVIDASDSVKDSFRCEIAEEIAMHMEDGARGFRFDRLEDLFLEALSEGLEKELPALELKKKISERLVKGLLILKSELATIGIKMEGDIKPHGIEVICFEWKAT